MTGALAPAPAGELTEADLIAAVRRGHDGAFEVLYRRYHDDVTRFVRGRIGCYARTEEVVQDVFLSALRRVRATSTEIAFRPWLFEIAKNAAIDHYRRASRTQEISIHADENMRPADQVRLVAAPHARPEVAIMHKERFDNLRASFGELSDSHRGVLVLRELEGLSYHEIAQKLDMTRPAVESALFRARRKLAQEYARAEAVA